MRILLDFSRPVMLAAVIQSVVLCPFGYDAIAPFWEVDAVCAVESTA